MTSLHELIALGQSPWVHGLSCAMLDDGTLTRLIEAGVRGAAMDPAEMGRAVADDGCHDERLRKMPPDTAARDAYFELLVVDAQRACDAFAAGTPGDSPGRDGRVSAGIDPDCARDTAATVAQAAWLHRKVRRPTFMVQIPATPEGVPAIEECTARGIPVDVTLLYSRQRHREAAHAYLAGLERFVQAGGSPADVGSVASFPLTWLDAEADRRLTAAEGPEDLRGTLATANAKLAYQTQQRVFAGGRWQELAAAGATPQFCRWTATTPSDLAESEVRYVRELIGPDSICTMSTHLLQAFCVGALDLKPGLDVEIEQAGLTVDRFLRAGVDYADVTGALEQWSLTQLAAAFHETVSLVGAALDEAYSTSAARKVAR